MPAPRTRAARKPPVATTIHAWEDDPLSAGAAPIERPVPALPKARTKLAFDVAQPPAGVYDAGTPEFRWWTAADTLVRTLAFWTPLLPKGTTWQRGAELTVRLDAGDKLNAFYNRQTLTFFHADIQGKVIFSGESPDVVAHECGHGILDAVRPQLWDAMSHEVAAFHESFGDMSAILTALQLPSVRTAVLAETGGVLYRSSRLSRLAEQLGWGIRVRTPCAAEPDCLRNAVNCFFYQPPEQLPIMGPAAILSSEPHSYSRVFTAGFFLMLTGMAITLSPTPDPDALQQASVDAGTMLIAAVRAAPIVPAYMSQVAAHLLAADKTLFGGKYAPAIENGFVGKGLISPTGASAAPSAFDALSAAAAAAAAGAARGGRRRDADSVPLPDTAVISVPAREFGFPDRPLLLQAPTEAGGLAITATGLDGGPITPASAETTARGFLRELLVRDSITVPGGRATDGLHTHEVVDEGTALRVVRRRVDAGVPFGTCRSMTPPRPPSASASGSSRR